MLDVHRLYFERAICSMRLAIDSANQTIAIHDGQAKITKLSQRLGHIAFDLVIKIKDFATSLALDDGIVKRR